MSAVGCPPHNLVGTRVERAGVGGVSRHSAFLRRGGPAGAGKLAGLDKKLSRSLEASVAERGSPSSMDLGKSPMGPLTEATRCLSQCTCTCKL